MIQRLPSWYKIFFLAFSVSALFSIYYFETSGPRHDGGLWPLMFAGFPWILIGVLPLYLALGLNALILLFVGYLVRGGDSKL